MAAGWLGGVAESFLLWGTSFLWLLVLSRLHPSV
jgi:hypothetical protein